MADEEESNAKKKRAARRYPYEVMATCEVDGQVYDVKLLNISTSGIQFACRVKLETQNAIKLIWADPQFGVFEATFLIAREIHKPENKEYQYYYGSQYYNLPNELKDKLLVLLRNFKDEIKKENQEQIEKITPEYLLGVIDQKEQFFKNVFDGQPALPYFDSLIKDVTQFEKTAFANDDALSKCVQKIATHNFHFNLLGMLTVFMVEKNDLQFSFFQHIQQELDQVKDLEGDIEEAGKGILNSSRKDEDKKEIQRKLNESSNRLFYTKQGLLQSVVETFVDIDPDAVDFRENLSKIREEYERILDFTNSSYQEEAKVYSRRSKKPVSYSKADAIVDLPVMSSERPSYLWQAIFFIIFAICTAYGVSEYMDYRKLDAIKDKTGLQIEIQRYELADSKCSFYVSGGEWKSLPPSHRQDTFEKIVRYLRNEPQIESCTLMDQASHIIKILYKDSKIQPNDGENIVIPAQPDPKSKSNSNGPKDTRLKPYPFRKGGDIHDVFIN